MAARSLLYLVVSLCLAAPPAHALTERTWVSSAGSDTNPCTFSAPCRQIGYAITQTNAGGIVSVKENSTFDPFTINKSVTIDGGGFSASIRHYGLDAIKITFLTNDAAGNTVVIRGLAFYSSGAGYGVLNNSNVTTHVHIEDCMFVRPITGVSMVPNAYGSTLKMTNVDIGEPGSYGVVFISPNGGTPGTLTMTGVRVTGGNYGLRVSDSVNGTVSDSRFQENVHGVYIDDATVHLTLVRTVLTQNSTTGLRHTVAGITTILDRCSIFGNATGILNTGSTVVGLSNNSIANNGIDVTGNPVTSVLQQ